jgi:D-lactate dehydrogenase (quinone)
VSHYKALDPCNAFNPGIGRTTKCAHWMPYGEGAEKRKFRYES